MQQAARTERSRRDDGILGQIKQWGPIITVLFACGVLYAQIQPVPQELKEARIERQQNKEEIAVLKSQSIMLEGLLKEIRDELRDARKSRGR